VLEVAAYGLVALGAHFAIEPVTGITLGATVRTVGDALLALPFRPVVARAYILLAAVVVALERAA